MSTDLCCFGTYNGGERVFYLGSTGNVHQASWDPELSQWIFANLTGLIHDAQPAAPGSALACFGALNFHSVRKRRVGVS